MNAGSRNELLCSNTADILYLSNFLEARWRERSPCFIFIITFFSFLFSKLIHSIIRRKSKQHLQHQPVALHIVIPSQTVPLHTSVNTKIQTKGTEFALLSSRYIPKKGGLRSRGKCLLPCLLLSCLLLSCLLLSCLYSNSACM